jgi:hypothetical protein
MLKQKPKRHWRSSKITKTLAHKICLAPTYKQEQYLKQACGIARVTKNWALEEWKRQYENGLKPSKNNLTR